ncbi:MAG: DNA polymerase I, partial [Rhizobiaceae bacterium]|nr:DNA polymerase I [Rhizobiaceae bacterium]
SEETGAEAGEIDPVHVKVEWGSDAHGPDVGSGSSVTPAAAAGEDAPASGEKEYAPAALAAKRAEQIVAQDVDRASYVTIRTLAELETWADEARNLGYFAFDTEATLPDPMQAELVGISIAIKPGKAAYVPLAHKDRDSDLLGGGLVEGQIPIRDALGVVKSLMEDRSILKIAQNLKHDLVVLNQHGIDILNYEDTMLLSYVCDAGSGGQTIEALSERWLGHSPASLKEITGTGRNALTFDLVAIDKATAYAAENSDVTLRLWLALKPRLISKGLTSVYERLERPLISVLGRMEQRGISVDRQILSRLSGDFAQGAAALEDEIYELAGGERFTIGSPKQLGDILFGKMGLPGGSKTKTGQWSTSAQVLEELAAEGHELPRKIVDWRQVTKLKSTYTDALPDYINPQSKRVHTSYALASTTTGRLSSSEPNLQNIPIRTVEGRKIRAAFIAEPGNKLISADYSQIELRVLAHVADIPQLRKAFEDGVDIHAMTASEMFSVPVEGMPPEVRRRAKAINFGIIYGISAFGLANQLGIERSEASEYISKYFERFPGIRDYMENTKAFCREHGYVETIFGRRAHYPEIRASNPQHRAFSERAAINAPIQGSAADIIRRAMVRMDAALDNARLANVQMLLQVHDELIFEAPEAEVEQAMPVICDIMENAAMPAISMAVPLHVDARAADNWDEAH